MTATQAELDAMQRQNLIPPQFEVNVGGTQVLTGTWTKCDRRRRALGTVQGGYGMDAVEVVINARDPVRAKWVPMP